MLTSGAPDRRRRREDSARMLFSGLRNRKASDLRNVRYSQVDRNIRSHAGLMQVRGFSSATHN
jgi:hypothetical protein